MNSELQIVPVSPETHAEAVHLFNEGFLPKFRAVHPDPALQASFAEDFGLIRSTDNDSDYIAVQGGTVLGVLLLEYAGMPKHLPSLTNRQLQEKYGLPALVRAMILDRIIHYHPGPGELYIDSIAVSEEARGRGIGSRLLDFTIEQARERQYGRVSLQVMFENPRAKALYERHGFQIISSKGSRWLKRKTGFSGAYFMEKQLP